MSDPTPVRAGEDAGREATGLPSEADYLRETIKVVEWQRDNARQERNEERARAFAAEAEVTRLTERLVATQHEVTDHGMLAVKANQLAEAAEAKVSALREWVARLEKALKGQADRIYGFRKGMGFAPDSPEEQALQLWENSARAALTEGAPTDV